MAATSASVVNGLGSPFLTGDKKSQALLAAPVAARAGGAAVAPKRFVVLAASPKKSWIPAVKSDASFIDPEWLAGLREKEMAAAQPVKVVALCGSLRKESYNRGLIRAAKEICEESIRDMEIEYVDISPLPFLNIDLESNGTYPPVIEAVRQKILQADSVLFASPETNYSVSAPLKNAIDWASRPPNVFADKAAAIVSASGSSRSAQYHLRQIGVFLDLHFINKPEFFLNAFQPPQKFDTDGNLIDADCKHKLKEVLVSLRAFTLRLRSKIE